MHALACEMLTMWTTDRVIGQYHLHGKHLKLLLWSQMEVSPSVQSRLELVYRVYYQALVMSSQNRYSVHSIIWTLDYQEVFLPLDLFIIAELKGKHVFQDSVLKRLRMLKRQSTVLTLLRSLSFVVLVLYCTPFPLSWPMYVLYVYYYGFLGLWYCNLLLKI